MASGPRNVISNFVSLAADNNVAGPSASSIQYIMSNGPGPSRTMLIPPGVSNLRKEDKPKRTRRKPRHKQRDDVDNALSANSPSTSLSPLIPSNSILLNTSSCKSAKTTPTKGLVSSKYKLGCAQKVDRHTMSAEKVEQFTFDIKPITNQLYGKIIRKKNGENTHINLKSFVTSVKSKCLVFTTKQSVLADLTNNISELNISKDDKKEKSKLESRKYPLKAPKRSRKKRDKSERELDETPFPSFLGDEEITLGLANGDFVKGFVRINPRKCSDSYVSNEDSSKADYCLTSVLDRNQALDGDEVVLQVKPESEWVDGNKTAKVVYISKKVHPRVVVGTLKPGNSKSGFALFHPRDPKCPQLRILEVSWPNGFKKDPKAFEDILFVAKITEWSVPAYAVGVLTENLGLSGDLKVETIAILKEYCLDTTPFGEEVREYLPQSNDIPEGEIEQREDIRKKCVFTIDPASARDLDDAVSVESMTNGNYEVGVHISDVSFYLDEGTELDQLVSKKATSIYMVDTVYHMLPVELCLHCSLLPGVNRLAFSVFWEITTDGDIINTRYTRSIMNSCAKLAYEHAQMIIENPDKNFTADDFPQIHNGFEPKDLANTVNILQSIAVILRDKRIQNGALKIDQVKLSFNLDPNSGLPLDYWKYENKESHRLIEEFMLLANISVAGKIYESFPDKAFLRCHEPPKQTMLVDLQNSLATYGIHLNIASSGDIANSLEKYVTSDYTGVCRQAVLNHLTAKAMTRARYFSSCTMESESDFKHYALSVPIYTHFTSPIRRYADVMVHRLLAASLNYRESPEWDQNYVCAIAANCNMQKYNAKRAGEASIELYLGTFIENHKPYEQDCVVIDVKERSFDVIVLKTGSIVRIYQNNCEQGTQWKIESFPKNDGNSPENDVNSPKNGVNSPNRSGRKQLRLGVTFPKTKYFPQSKITVEIFSIVKAHLQKKEKSYKLEGTLLRPVPAQVFNRR